LTGINHCTVIKGDSIYFSIAAASVLAKTCRDEYMVKIHAEFPQYGWDRNKGYPTSFHRAAILKYGITPYHRKSFSLIDTQMRFEF
jgi:ribonuclease HII